VAAISTNSKDHKVIEDYALAHSFINLPDESGTNIGAQIIDTAILEKR
jgi:hypothetical protein